MAPTFPTWCVRTVFIALAVHWTAGSDAETCKIWASAGKIVERNSSFRVFCTFPSTCEWTLSLDRKQDIFYRHLNSSTVYIDAVILTDVGTVTCRCKSGRSLCGLDIRSGYPPGRHEAPTCIKNDTDFVECRWKSLTETHLPTTSALRVSSLSNNLTGVPVTHPGSSVGTGSFMAGWSVNSSIQMISVEVLTSNELGQAKPDTFNFTLGDIVKPSPPVLNLVDCSSRSCKITWHHSLKPHLQVQYSDVTDLKHAEEDCIPHPDLDWQNSSYELPSVLSLEPSRLYCFRARAKLNSGLWSDWSRPVQNRTQEEAPNKELDTWFARANSGSNILNVYWKPLTDSEARGKVLGYLVHINDNHSKKTTTYNVSANTVRHSVQSCVTCLVTVSAYNSKGSSPPARIPTLFKTAQPPQELLVTESKDNVSLYWRRADSTLQSTGYLVEWYPQDQQFEKLQWMRLSSAERQAVITEIDPYECYDGAVYVFYENALAKASFTGVNTLVSVPTGTPQVTSQVEGCKVTLTWTQIPRLQRGGCVRNYTVYVGNNNVSQYHVPASERQYTIDYLPPDTYIVWVTGWTEQGEGPRGVTNKFIIKPEINPIPWLLLATFIIIAFLLCLFKLLARWQRVKMILIALKNVPDPSNSKCGKAFTDNKSEMDLNENRGAFSSSTSSSSEEEEEEEKDIVKFLENPKEDDEDSGHCEGLTDAPSVRRSTHWDSGTAPQTPYLKSFSQASDCSHYTHSSQDTGTTAGYLSSQMEQGVPEDEGQEEEEEEEEEEERIDFYPCNVFDKPLVFGGGLTLDAVKIDCRNLWENDC